MTNKEIRRKLWEYGLTQFDLAKLLGVSESTIYRRLREEFSPEDREKILQIIEKEGARLDR